MQKLYYINSEKNKHIIFFIKKKKLTKSGLKYIYIALLVLVHSAHSWGRKCHVIYWKLCL